MIRKQFTRFIIIGVFSTIINYGVFYSLHNFLDINYLISSATGFIAGVFAGFGFNKSWTFEAEEDSKAYVLKYYVVYTVSLFLGLGFLKVLVDGFGIISKMISTNKLQSERSYLYIGIVLKIVIGTLLASHFLSDLFIPFVNYYVESGFVNPYAQFLEKGPPQSFPYPALMLYILTLPKVLLGWLDPDKGIGFFDLFIYRLPLLIADLSIFFILRSWLKDKSSKLIWFYWFSPVVIYINYVHGQLDVIPIALLFGSLYFLFKNRFMMTALFLGLALASKTNVALVVPFFFLYLLSKGTNLKDMLLFNLILAGTFFTLNLPYLFDSSFFAMVFQNQEQGKVLQAAFSFNNISFYLIPASMMILFAKGLLIKNYNKDIFIMFLGFSFSIILLFISPMQGWYFWLLPFLAYFYIKEKGRSPILFFGLQLFYFLYFIFSKNADYLEVLQFVSPELASGKTIYAQLHTNGADAGKFLSLVFTMLQTTLLVNCLWIYKRGLESYSKHKITSSPYLIGIGGNSGVGKTTISDTIKQIFTPHNTTILRGDDMHKWQRGHQKWQELTHLNPKANFLHQEIHFLKRLKSGKRIYRRTYDHSTGQFTPVSALKPNNITIFEGLHPFYLAEQRNLYDLKCFVKPEPQLMHHWKIIRDMQKRGHSKDLVLEQIKSREKDSEAYIAKQSLHADILIEPKSVNKINNLGDENEEVKVYYDLHLSNSIFLEPLLDELSEVETLKIEHNYSDNDKQTLRIEGEVSSEITSKVASKMIHGLLDVGGITSDWPADAYGVLLLVIAYYIFEEADNETL